MATPSKIDFRKQIKKHQNASLLNDENNGKQVVGEIIAIPKNDLYADDNQVRKHFSPESLEEMRVSLENQDQIQPIVVWPLDSKGYKIQKGERRWRGAMLSDKVTHLQCIIKKTSSTLEQLAENLIRDNLTPFEIGRAFIKAQQEEGLDNKQLGAKLGFSEPRVSQYIKVAECPSYIESAYKSGVVGDIDTINSLRIADTLDSDATQRAVNEASTITRSDARALTKQLKSGPTSEAVDGPTHPVTDTAAPDQTDDTQDQEREPPETTTPSPQREKTAPKTDKTPKTQPTGQPCGIRVRVDGDVGVIDMNGQAQAGEIVIVLDNANGTLTVPASDVELLGYAFDA